MTLCLFVLTKLLVLRMPSIIPALKAAQFKLPLSFGMEMNLLTSASFSMR